MSRSNRINEGYELLLRIRGFDTNAMAREIDERTQRLMDLGWPTDNMTFSLDREVLELLRITAGKVYQIGAAKRLSDDAPKGGE